MPDIAELGLPAFTDPDIGEVTRKVLDPRIRRYMATAAISGTYFDVPYMSHLQGTLWQGGVETGLILPPGIRHVISLYPFKAYTVMHHLRSELKVLMVDQLDGVDPALVEATAEWVIRCMNDGPTLLHCEAGLNRSSLVAARVLIRTGMSAEDAISLIRAKRSPACLCNPAFEAWIRTY